MRRASCPNSLSDRRSLGVALATSKRAECTSDVRGPPGVTSHLIQLEGLSLSGTTRRAGMRALRILRVETWESVRSEYYGGRGRPPSRVPGHMDTGEACCILNPRYREGDRPRSPKGRASPTAFAIRYTAVGDDRPPRCRLRRAFLLTSRSRSEFRERIKKGAKYQRYSPPVLFDVP